MARGKKSGGKNFEKGHAGGPGRPPVPEDVAEARKLNRAELERLLNAHIYKTAAEIQAVIRDPKSTALDLVVCTILLKAVKDGDSNRLTFILDRLVGRVKDVVEVTAPVPFIIRRMSGEEVVLGSQPQVLPLPIERTPA